MILYVLTKYAVGDGLSTAVYSQIANKQNHDEYCIIAKKVESFQDDLNISEYSKGIVKQLFKNGNCSYIHYYKGITSDILYLVNKLRPNHIPILTTVCQRPSYKSLILSPFELKLSNHFVLIDKTSYNDPILSFVPLELKSHIYLSSGSAIKKRTEAIVYKEAKKEIVFGRGTTLPKCPKDMFDVFDKIDISNKKFYIAGVPLKGNWVAKEAEKRDNVYMFGHMPYDEWFEVCKSFDIMLYHIPKDSHASLDANLGLAMQMSKPVVYYGSEAPKERFIHGYNGLVAETTDEISRYATELANNFERRRELGRNARKSSIEDFSFETRMRKYDEVVSGLNVNNTVPKIPVFYYFIYLKQGYKSIIKIILHRLHILK